MLLSRLKGTIATINTGDSLGREDAMGGTAEEIARRLDAGEWLRPGDVAILLDVSRSTVTRMLDSENAVIRYRLIPGTGRHRELHPEDVRRQLDERRRVHGERKSE